LSHPHSRKESADKFPGRRSPSAIKASGDVVGNPSRQGGDFASYGAPVVQIVLVGRPSATRAQNVRRAGHLRVVLAGGEPDHEAVLTTPRLAGSPSPPTTTGRPARLRSAENLDGRQELVDVQHPVGQTP